MSDCLHLAHFIPIKPNSKEPIGKWLQIRLSISECLSLIERGYNIGIVANKDGLCFVDVDNPNVVSKLKLEYTLVVKTPHGGYHYYYRNCGIDRNRYLNGYELRCHNAYVLCPGSVVDDKTYSIVFMRKINTISEQSIYWQCLQV